MGLETFQEEVRVILGGVELIVIEDPSSSSSSTSLERQGLMKK